MQFKQFLTEVSLAHAQAKRLGLEYFGFGRYGTKGTVTHHAVRGRLEKLPTKYSKDKGENVLLHYEHLEDAMFNKGAEGAHHAIDILHSLHKEPGNVATQTKIDGSPSLFFGKKGGKFFVATKSLYNKDPKINYTHKDVDANHGHAPGLAAKLHVALDELPKIYKGSGDSVLQGDVMFTHDDVDVRDIDGKKHFTFKPNVTRNAIDVSTEEGKKIGKAKLGFAVHTRYNEAGERLPASHIDVGTHPDVYVMGVDAPEVGKVDDKSFVDATHLVDNTPKEAFDFASSPEVAPLLKQYYNGKIREQKEDDANAKDFIRYVTGYLQKDVDKVKTQAVKDAKLAKNSQFVGVLTRNLKKLDQAFLAYKAIIKAKHDVIDTLNQKQPIKRYFDNPDGTIRKTNPEGYVAIGSSGTHKLIKRSEFSHANFTQPKNWGDKTVEEAPKKSDKAVVTIGRMSPPHIEHSHLIDAVVKQAKAVQGDPYVFVTHTQDNKKNPLTSAEKIEVLHSMYPNNKDMFEATSKESPSIYAKMQELYKRGYKKVTLVIGDDRVEDMQGVLKYNGVIKDGKGYKFDNIDVISRHDIMNTKSGHGDGVHASDVRNAAINGDMETFGKAMHPNVPKKLQLKIAQAIRDRIKQ
jgi:hypothetical protein